MERLQKYFGPYITIGTNGIVYITGDAVGEGEPATFMSDLFAGDLHSLYEKNHPTLVIPSVPVILSNIMIKINDMSMRGDMRCARWMATQFPNIQFRNCFYVQKQLYEKYNSDFLDDDWIVINDDTPTMIEETPKFKPIMLVQTTDFKIKS